MTDPTLAALEALRGLRCVDLSHPLEATMPVFPSRTMQPFERVQTVTLATGGVNTGRFTMTEHTGTHLDAPCHFIEDGIAVDAIPVAHLVCPAVVVDATAGASRDPDHRLTVAELDAWEAAHGTVPEGAFVLVRTGWGSRWTVPSAYVNRDEDGIVHHPAVTPEAAGRLVERGALGVGIDTLSVDNASPSEIRSPAHKVLHGSGRYVLENLAGLDRLPPTGILLVIGALPIVGGTGGPARVLAFIV